MAGKAELALAELLATNEAAILSEWQQLLRDDGMLRGGRMGEGDLRRETKDFLDRLRRAAGSGNFADIGGADYAPIREMLDDLSRSRATQGFSPGETATFVFSLKQPLFNSIRTQMNGDAEGVAAATWMLTLLLDKLGLYTMEAFQRSREQVIIQQQQEIAELSTPVVKLWQGILALPLIGTLDSARTQVIMENLLQAIVDQNAEIAIIDITGVPTVDTLVAQHLLKTVAAARLMGADCIVSGIRPQIAQTMVHLGVELDVISKASLADAFAVALRRIGRTVVPVKAAGGVASPAPAGRT
jgi:rsbT co-antagonist protein RsbR